MAIAKMVVVAAMALMVCGCNYSTQAKDVTAGGMMRSAVGMRPDPMSAAELVKTHPALQRICDLAGGCSNVDIECEKFSDTGNTILRGNTMWSVHALGTRGSGFQSYGKPIERAVTDWFEARRIEENLNEELKAQTKVFPVPQPCESDCIAKASK